MLSLLYWLVIGLFIGFIGVVAIKKTPVYGKSGVVIFSAISALLFGAMSSWLLSDIGAPGFISYFIAAAASVVTLLSIAYLG